MFGWRWELGGPWDSKGIEGVYRFLHRVWDLILAPVSGGGEAKEPAAETIKALRRKVHQTIKKATEDLTDFSFNTYIAALMELSNLMGKVKKDLYATPAWAEAAETLSSSSPRPARTWLKNSGPAWDGSIPCITRPGRFGMRNWRPRRRWRS